MAKAKAAQELDTPDELETPMGDGLDTVPDEVDLDAAKKTTFDSALASNRTKSKDSHAEAIESLDLTEEEEDHYFLGDEPELHKYVVARYMGTSGSPDGYHAQVIQGQKATFPLNKLVVVQYMYVKSARRSGYVDFISNPGKKQMKKQDNIPTIVVQDVIPDEFQSPNKIMEYIDLVAKTKGKRLILACDSL